MGHDPPTTGPDTTDASRWTRLVRSPWAVWVLVYAVGVLALGRIRPAVVGANDSSRYATMIAIVEHGTYYIDGVYLADRTMDKVRVGARDLSTKPPVLSTLGAALYAVLHHGFGLSFRRNEGVVVRVLVALLCTVPLLVLLLMLHGLLRREGLDPGVSLGATALLGLGTLAFPFGTILVNHLPSTAALFGAFVCARELRAGRRTGWRWAFAAGLLGCLAVTFELTAVFGAVAVTLYLFSDGRRWSLAGAFVAGLALPASLHLWITWRTTSHVLPVQLRPELWSFAGSYWNHPRSWDALREPKWRYGLQCFFGGRGLFTLTPVLLVSLVGMWRGLRRGDLHRRRPGPGRDPDHPGRLRRPGDLHRAADQQLRRWTLRDALVSHDGAAARGAHGPGARPVAWVERPDPAAAADPPRPVHRPDLLVRQAHRLRAPPDEVRLAGLATLGRGRLFPLARALHLVYISIRNVQY